MTDTEISTSIMSLPPGTTYKNYPIDFKTLHDRLFEPKEGESGVSTKLTDIPASSVRGQNTGVCSRDIEHTFLGSFSDGTPGCQQFSMVISTPEVPLVYRKKAGSSKSTDNRPRPIFLSSKTATGHPGSIFDLILENCELQDTLSEMNESQELDSEFFLELVVPMCIPHATSTISKQHIEEWEDKEPNEGDASALVSRGTIDLTEGNDDKLHGLIRGLTGLHFHEDGKRHGRAVDTPILTPSYIDLEVTISVLPPSLSASLSEDSSGEEMEGES